MDIATKIEEEDNFKIHVDKKTLSDKTKTKELGTLQKKNPSLEFDLDGGTSSSQSMAGGSTGLFEEPEAVIAPQDKATIKYLSNVKDSTSGEISKPFTIGEKKYQMVRGIDQTNQVVMGVFCHDDFDAEGENIIHPMDYFEETIAKPMKETMDIVGQDIQIVPTTPKPKANNLSDFKHFILNSKTGKVRKFRKIEELAKANMLDEESYMNLPQFKKYVSEKLFGSRTRSIREVTPIGDEDEEQMNAKAKKLMELIKTKIPSNVIETIKTPVAQREVIAAFAEMIGVPRTGLSNLMSGLKALAKGEAGPIDQPQPQGVNESRNVIKVIKVKDLQ